MPINFRKVPGYIRSELSPPGGPLQNGGRGTAVKRLQEWLCLHGFLTAVDGQFGDATEECVREFQSALGLSVRGIVNDRTWRVLVRPLFDALSEPEGVQAMTTAEAVLAVATQHLAQHPVEVGGANRGPWVRVYCHGKDGPEYPWCAGFVSMISDQAHFYRGTKPPIKGSLSCDLIATQAQRAGRFVRGRDIASGRATWPAGDSCCLFLRRRVVGDWTHTGFAVPNGGSLVFDTIEGNTNDEGSREGFEACRRKRSAAGGDYDFVRIG